MTDVFEKASVTSELARRIIAGAVGGIDRLVIF